MKVITEEEKNAENKAVLLGSVRGLAIGAMCSLGIYAAAKARFRPLLRMSASAKSATFVTPPLFFALVDAEKGNNKFDKEMYSHDEEEREKNVQRNVWNSMSTKEQIRSTLSNGKYKIITGIWALSLWGSWKLANRDQLLSKAQRFYNARMYAQFVTLLLLLGSIGLSMKDEQKHRNTIGKDDYFSRILSAAKSREATL